MIINADFQVLMGVCMETSPPEDLGFSTIL